MRRILQGGILVAFVLSAHLGMAQSVVISEVYGGGGNSGAPYQNDFIELYNPTSSPVDLSTWSVQYTSAAGNSWGSNKTNLSGTINPGAYYLIQEASNAAVGSVLPTPNATGNIAMSATAGKVALVSSTVALTGTNPTGPTLVDLVGYGATANGFEGAGPAPAPSATLSIERKANSASTSISMGVGGIDEFLGNGYDANSNSTDFVTRSPQPQNSSSTNEQDVTPPTFTSTYPKAANITESSFDLIVSLNEGGKAYYVILSDAVPAPSVAQVKLGQNDLGDPVANSGFVSVIASLTEATKNITGLFPSTSYDVYIVAVDAASNTQASTVKLDVTTTVSTAPIINPSTASITFPGFTDKAKQSTQQSYSITAANLTDNVELSVSGNFLLSSDNVTYASSISLDKTLFGSAQTVYVKFNPNGNSGTQTGTITNSTIGGTNKLVALSATAIDPLNQNFNDPLVLSNSGWTQYSKVGAQVWATTNFGHTCLVGCNAGTLDKAVQINGFATSAQDNQDWLISPQMDLTGFANFPALSFWTISAFAGNSLQLKYSSDYTGSGDPTLATWTDIDGKFPATNSSLWTKSSNIILPNSSIYVAIVYTSTTAGASRWTFDDWKVEDLAGYVDVPAIVFSFGEISAGNSSSSQNFTFTGNGLGDITVSAPLGYEVSADNTVFSTTTLVSAADVLSGKTVYVRFSPAIKQLKWDGTLTFSGTSYSASFGSLTGSSYPKSETFDITAYNLEFFGSNVADGSGEFGPVDDALQVSNVTTVMQTIGSDIFSVEEVSDDASMDQLVAGLPGYDKLMSDRWSYSFNAPDPTFPPQKIGIVYKTSTVQIVDSRVMFSEFYDDIRAAEAVSLPAALALLPGYPSSGGNTPSNFWSSGRLPFIVTADVTVNSFTKRVKIVVLHSKSGSAQADYDRRKYDVQLLHDSLVTNYPNDNIIVLGDFNDDVDASINTGSPSSYKMFVDDASNFSTLTYALSQAGGFSFPSSSSFLDHIIISNELTSDYVSNSILVEDPRTYISGYTTTTSDHLPVSARFVLAKANQTITFNALPSKTYGDASFALTATTTSGLPISYTSSDASIASISGSTVTILKAGTVDITASQSGDVSYLAATSVAQPLLIQESTSCIGCVAEETIWGVTSNGGPKKLGTIGHYLPSESKWITDFDDFSVSNLGTSPGEMTYYNDKFYGIASRSLGQAGIIYEWNPITNVYSIKVEFSGVDGSVPTGMLVLAYGKFYGMTLGGGINNLGVIFEWDPTTNIYTKKYDFNGTDGSVPGGCTLTLYNDKFYGFTNLGGVSNSGVIFQWDPFSNNYEKKIDLTSTQGTNLMGALVNYDGKFYGVAQIGPPSNNGSIFEWDPFSNTFTKKMDFTPTTGNIPIGSLTLVEGKFYGLTRGNGANGGGTIYEWDPVSNIVTPKINLTLNGPEGSTPNGRLMYVNEKFYGVTSAGGINNLGTIFEWDASTNQYTKKIDLEDVNGKSPQGALTFANGKFFGTTLSGGLGQAGVIFEWDISQNSYSKKIDFSYADMGKFPQGSLNYFNGKFYGTTNSGGTDGYGVIFEWDPVTATYAKEYDFHFATGGNPREITLYNNKFYGVTQSGGANGLGVIFEWDPVLNVYTKKFDMSTSLGNQMMGSMTLKDDKFYGLARTGGTSNAGVIFIWYPSTNVFTKKIDLTNTNGTVPNSSLVYSDSKFYSTTAFGGTGIGVIFEWDPSTNVYTKKINLTTPTGTSPGKIINVGSKFYGLGNAGGANGGGVAFEWDPSTNVYTKKIDFNATIGSRPNTNSLLYNGNLFYGSTSLGGVDNLGTIFTWDPVTNGFTKKVDFTVSTGTVTINTQLLLMQGLRIFQKIDFGAISDKQFGESSFDLTATSTSGLPIVYTSSDPFIASIVNNTVTINKIGTVSITASQNGSTNYLAAEDVIQPLVINKASQTITFSALSAKTFGDAVFDLTATSTSGLAVSFTSSDPTVASISGKTVTIHKAGTVNIIASQVGDDNYLAASSVPQSLVINKATHTIAFGSLSAKTFGDATFNLSALSTSGLTTTFTSSDPAIASISGNTVTIQKAGTVTITAAQVGNDNYLAATGVDRSLVINKASQTITFSALPAKSFGDTPFDLTATSTSGLSVSFASSDPTIASIVGNTVTINKAGTVTITATQNGNDNYLAASDVAQTLVINKPGQTITFGPLASKTFGGSPFDLTATSTSGLVVSFTSSDPAIASIAGQTVTIKKGGTVTITASQGGNDNYSAATDVTQLLVINKASQSITFAAIPTKTAGDAAFSLTATATSTLAVSFSTTSDKVNLSGSQVTIVKPGSVTITASQTGNDSYSAATSENQTFCINPAKPTITLSNVNTESPTLTSSSTTGNQWYLNGTAITGATNATYSAATAGIYKVQVKADNCVSAFSNDTPLIVTGDIKQHGRAEIAVYPNPVEDYLTITGLPAETTECMITDMTGRTATLKLERQNGTHRADVRNYGTGLYLIRVQTGNEIHQIKFIKK